MDKKEELVTLVRAVQTGDHHAFTQLVKRFEAMAQAITYLWLGDRFLAQDAVQDAWLEVYRCLPALRSPEAFPLWFRRVLLKQADRITRRRTLLPLMDEHATTSLDADPLSVVEQRELQQMVRQALTRLPAEQQSSVLLFYFRQYSQADIAAQLGISPGAVRKRLFDARRRLREALAASLYDEQTRAYHKSANRQHRPVPVEGSIRMQAQILPLVVAFEDGYVSTRTGTHYMHSADGTLRVCGVWPRWKYTALALGVDLEHAGNITTVLVLAGYYRVRLTEKLARQLVELFSHTEELCALLIAISRLQALEAIPGQEEQWRDCHETYIWAANQGLTNEPSWAYRVAQELYGRPLSMMSRL